MFPPSRRVPVLFGKRPASGNGLLTALIAYWKLDEAAGANDALDASGNSLTLTQNFSPGSAAGVISTARTFTGTAWFIRNDDASLSTGDVDFTISAWVYLTNTTGNYTVFSRYITTGNQREFALYYNYNDHAPNSRFTFVVSSNGTLTSQIDATTFGAPSATTWYHVCAWHDAANNQIGIAVNDTADTAAYANGVFDSTSTTQLGRLAATYVFSGRIDEVGFWKSAAGGGGVLTATKRTALYNSGAGLAYESFTA